MKAYLIISICSVSVVVIAFGAQIAGRVSTGSAPAQPPVIQYDQRYSYRSIDNTTRAVLDSATGKLWLAQRAKIGLDRWNVYDLNAIASEKAKDVVMKAAPLSEREVFGRYAFGSLEDQGSLMVVIDTLTGRLWSCRQESGKCDVWKFYNLEDITE